MKILQLCIRVPFPPSDGATIAMYNLGKSLADNGAKLKILSFNTNKNFVSEKKIPESFRAQTKIETVNIDLSVNPVDAFINLFGSGSYNISRFVSAEFDAKLQRILSEQDFDIVQLEGLYLSPCLKTIRKYSHAKIVLRSHNVEFMIWERLAQSAKNPLKKWYIDFLAGRLKKYEISLLNLYDAIVPISPVDENIFKLLGCRIPVYTAPVGIDVKDYTATGQSPEEFSIFHLGSMDWMPNQDAVGWLLGNVYPGLVEKNPGIRIYLAGKDMPQKIFDKAGKNLVVAGRIENAKKFMSDKTVMIVPLLSGGGMRVKIIEGMAAGKAVVSTTIGAEGINYTNGKNILIADTAADFIAAIEKLYNEKYFCNLTGVNARKLAEEQYDNTIIGKNVLNFYEKLVTG